jgi:hypothetical protein
MPNPIALGVLCLVDGHSRRDVGQFID